MSEPTELPPYLTTPCPSVWDYADNGDVLLWVAEQKTAAVSGELGGVLRELCQHTTLAPPLTSLLFIVDSVRLKQKATATLADRVSKLFDHSIGQSRLPPEGLIRWLVSLAELPSELSRSVVAKARLLHVLFSGLPRHLHEADLSSSSNVFTFLEMHASERLSGTPIATLDAFRCKRALDCLAFAAVRHPDVKKLELRLRTGFTDVPDESVLEDDEHTEKKISIEQILATLRDDPELSAMANAAVNAASLLSLPRTPTQSDELPAGGVSDITNRGHPERLLATELAADPMLLLARIATGSALYLRREKPPNADQAPRQIFVEDSIRMWGASRRRGCIVALASALSEYRKTGTDAILYSVAGHCVTEENTTTRAGIEDFLGRISPSRHPALGLLEAVQNAGGSESGFECEPLLILTGQTDADKTFTTKMQEFPRPFLVARIDRDATVTLLRRSDMGDEILHKQSVQLPSSAVTSRAEESRPLPLYHRLQYPRPLRCSIAFDGEFHEAVAGPILWLVDRSGQVFLYDRKQLGCVDMGRLPSGDIIASQCIGNQIRFVVHSRRSGLNHLANFSSSGESSIEMLEYADAEYAFDRGRLLAIKPNRIHFLDARSGKKVGEISDVEQRDLRTCHLDRGLFSFQEAVMKYRLFQITFEAGAGKWHSIGTMGEKIGLALRDSSGNVSCFSADYSTMRTFDGEKVKEHRFDKSYNVLRRPKIIRGMYGDRVALDFGHSLVNPNFKLVPSAHHLEISLRNPSVRSVRFEAMHSLLRFLNPSAAELLSHRSVRTKFRRIALTEEGIYLWRSAEQIYRIVPSGDTMYLESERPPAAADFETFEIVEGGPADDERGRKWQLKQATFSGGVAWLDRRGMLHLRRQSDRSELSLVLDNTHFSGWFSESNQVFGTKYFCGEDTPVPLGVTKWLKEFATTCKRSPSS